MRHVMLAALLALVTAGVGGGRAFATPFEPGTVPDQVQAVGHLDVDALRKTQLFAAVGGQTAIEAALDEAPAELQPLARSLVRTLRGVSFWHGGEHGALYLETRDARALAQLVSKLPVKPAGSIDGTSTYIVSGFKPNGGGSGGGSSSGSGKAHHHGGTHHVAVFGDTLVLADSAESLEQSIHVLGGKAASLAGSNKLPISARQGVFVFVTLGDSMLNHIQQVAHSKVLQLGLRSLAVDVGEGAGTVTATARAEMRSADALQKAKSIVDGLRALASLSDEPAARTLLDGLTVTTSGLALEVVARLPVSEVTKAMHTTK